MQTISEKWEHLGKDYQKCTIKNPFFINMNDYVLSLNPSSKLFDSAAQQRDNFLCHLLENLVKCSSVERPPRLPAEESTPAVLAFYKALPFITAQNPIYPSRLAHIQMKVCCCPNLYQRGIDESQWHSGVNRTTTNIAAHWWWPGYYDDFSEYHPLDSWRLQWSQTGGLSRPARTILRYIIIVQIFVDSPQRLRLFSFIRVWNKNRQKK